MKIISADKIWELIHDKLYQWMEIGAKHIPNVVVAIIITIVFALIARFAASGFKRLLHSSIDSSQIAGLFAAIIKVVILGIGIFIALDFLGLKGTVTSLLAGAGIIGLALGFAFQDMTENLIAGISMGIRKPFRIGDVIEAEDVFGTVEHINLRNTLVKTFYGQRTLIPNKILFQNKLTNYSVTGIRRIEVPVGISYADDPEQAREIIIDAINQCDFVIKQDETDVYCEGFGDSSVNLLVWFWIKYPGETGFMKARHTAVATVKGALEENDILIPFPIRTLDFAAKGGKQLDTILQESRFSSSDEKDSE